MDVLVPAGYLHATWIWVSKLELLLWIAVSGLSMNLAHTALFCHGIIILARFLLKVTVFWLMPVCELVCLSFAAAIAMSP